MLTSDSSFIAFWLGSSKSIIPSTLGSFWDGLEVGVAIWLIGVPVVLDKILINFLSRKLSWLMLSSFISTSGISVLISGDSVESIPGISIILPPFNVASIALFTSSILLIIFWFSASTSAIFLSTAVELNLANLPVFSSNTKSAGWNLLIDPFIFSKISDSICFKSLP